MFLVRGVRIVQLLWYSTFRCQQFSPNIDSVGFCSSPTDVALVLSQVLVSL